MNLFAEYAEDLACAHCGAKNRAEQWLERGDLEPFFNQTEPGQYSFTVHCPSCNKDWYVVWDDNPGAMRQLEPPPNPTTSPQPAPDPAKADGLAQRGLECLRAGNTDEAITHLSTALQHDANHFGALQSLGLAHGVKGDHTQAATHLEAALRVNSNAAPAHFNLGVVYQKQGKTAEAIREMEAALQLKPDYPQAQQALAKLRATAGPPSPGERPAAPQLVQAPEPSKPQEQPWVTYRAREDSKAVAKIRLKGFNGPEDSNRLVHELVWMIGRLRFDQSSSWSENSDTPGKPDLFTVGSKLYEIGQRIDANAGPEMVTGALMEVGMHYGEDCKRNLASYFSRSGLLRRR